MGVLGETPTAAAVPARPFSGLSRRMTGRFPACTSLGDVPIQPGLDSSCWAAARGEDAGTAFPQAVLLSRPCKPNNKVHPNGGWGWVKQRRQLVKLGPAQEVAPTLGFTNLSLDSLLWGTDRISRGMLAPWSSPYAGAGVTVSSPVRFY